MVKKIILITTFFTTILFSEELKVKAKTFNADQKNGISIFTGSVNAIKGNDELNASKVTIYTDKNNEPTKFIAEGDASFYIVTLEGNIYTGKAQKVVYMAQQKEYQFYKSVHLKQLNERKEIVGDEVILKSLEGTAYAKGAEKEPVIMIFNVPEDSNQSKKTTKQEKKTK
jgi:lipopolysaccharide export system protein LptA